MIITSIYPLSPLYPPSLPLSHFHTPLDFPLLRLYTPTHLLSFTSISPYFPYLSPLHIPYCTLPLPLFQRPPNSSVSIGALQNYMQRGHTDAIERKMQYAALLHSNSHQGAVNLLVRVFFSATKVHREDAYCCNALLLHLLTSVTLTSPLPSSPLLTSPLFGHLFSPLFKSFPPFSSLFLPPKPRTHTHRTKSTSSHPIPSQPSATLYP